MELFARKPTGRRPKGPCPLGGRASLTSIESSAVLKYMSSKKRQMTQPAHKRLVLTDHHGK